MKARSAPLSPAVSTAVDEMIVSGVSPASTADTTRAAPPVTRIGSASMPYLVKKPCSWATQTGAIAAFVVLSPSRKAKGAGGAAGAAALPPLGAAPGTEPAAVVPGATPLRAVLAPLPAVGAAAAAGPLAGRAAPPPPAAQAASTSAASTIPDRKSTRLN